MKMALCKQSIIIFVIIIIIIIKLIDNLQAELLVIKYRQKRVLKVLEGSVFRDFLRSKCRVSRDLA